MAQQVYKYVLCVYCCFLVACSSGIDIPEEDDSHEEEEVFGVADSKHNLLK